MIYWLQIQNRQFQNRFTYTFANEIIDCLLK